MISAVSAAVPIPELKNKRGGNSIYPFDQLTEIGQSFGVKGKKDIGSNEHGVIVGKGTAELFAESNMGTSTVPISVLGTTIGNALPPTALALGVRSSLSVEVPISDSVSFTGGGSVSLRTDGLISGAATAKISGSF